MRQKFLVELDIPEDATPYYVTQYIKEAVSCWHGGKDPEDPIYDLDKKSVKVKQIKEIAEAITYIRKSLDFLEGALSSLPNWKLAIVKINDIRTQLNNLEVQK